MFQIQVLYIDDYSIKHICVVNSFTDLRFLQERFDVIEYEVM